MMMAFLAPGSMCGIRHHPTLQSAICAIAQGACRRACHERAGAVAVAAAAEGVRTGAGTGTGAEAAGASAGGRVGEDGGGSNYKGESDMGTSRPQRERGRILSSPLLMPQGYGRIELVSQAAHFRNHAHLLEPSSNKLYVKISVRSRLEIVCSLGV